MLVRFTPYCLQDIQTDTLLSLPRQTVIRPFNPSSTHDHAYNSFVLFAGPALVQLHLQQASLRCLSKYLHIIIQVAKLLSSIKCAKSAWSLSSIILPHPVFEREEGRAKQMIAPNIVAELMTATRTSRGPLHRETVAWTFFFPAIRGGHVTKRSTVSLCNRSDFPPANGRFGYGNFRLGNSQADSQSTQDLGHMYNFAPAYII